MIELQIGDSPFTSTAHAIEAGTKAIKDGQTHYCPSMGLMSFRETVAANYQKEYGIDITADERGGRPRRQGVRAILLRGVPRSRRCGVGFQPRVSDLRPQHRAARRPSSSPRISSKRTLSAPICTTSKRSSTSKQRAKAIFLNSPHNPTGGVATESDLKAIADLVRGKNIAVFSDEPYNHMVWAGKHHPLLAQPGIIDQVVACYTFSKSYSMSGWRLGYAVSSPRMIDTIGKMINTSLSCVPPIVQLAGEAALKNDDTERDEVMQRFKKESGIAGRTS